MNFVPPLQEMCFAPAVNRYFNDPAPPEEAFLSQMLRNTYHKIREDQNGRIKEVRERTMAQLKTFFEAARKSVELERLQEQLRINGSFGNEWLSEMYQNGAYDFSLYVYYHSVYGNKEEIQKLKEHWLQKVKADFEEGKPHSFPMIATWIREREISCAGSEPLFDDPKIFLPLLKKLAYLGVTEAQDTLSSAYQYNELGAGESTIQLNLSVEDRIAGLWELVFWGHAYSKYTLGSFYFRNNLNKGMYSILEDARRKGMEKLIEIEGNIPNGQITAHFAKNCIGDLKCNYSLEERLSHLTKKAKNGDWQAFEFLREIYHTGKMPNDDLSLELNEEQRKDHFQELRTEKNETLYRDFLALSLIDPTPLFPCQLTEIQRVEALAQQLSSERGSRGLVIHTLERCYLRNRWKDGQQLGIPFETRLKNLEELASIHKARDAIWAVAAFYLPDLLSEYVIDEIEQIPEELEIQKRDEIPYEERFKHIFDLAIQGEHWNFIQEIIQPQLTNQTLKEIVTLLISHLESIRYFY